MITFKPRPTGRCKIPPASERSYIIQLTNRSFRSSGLCSDRALRPHRSVPLVNESHSALKEPFFSPSAFARGALISTGAFPLRLCSLRAFCWRRALCSPSVFYLRLCSLRAFCQRRAFVPPEPLL